MTSRLVGHGAVVRVSLPISVAPATGMGKYALTSASTVAASTAPGTGTTVCAGQSIAHAAMVTSLNRERYGRGILESQGNTATTTGNAVL
jgi:hypothetical protein